MIRVGVIELFHNVIRMIYRHFYSNPATRKLLLIISNAVNEHKKCFAKYETSPN
jgi:hypothetical protein